MADRCRAAALWDEANVAWKCMHRAVDAGDFDAADVWAEVCAGAAFDWVREIETAK